MRVVWMGCPAQAIEERRRRGHDRLDEVWEGEYHMAPAPSGRHQDITGDLYALLRRHLEGRAKVCLGWNVRQPGTGMENFRVPDVSVVALERAAIAGETFIEGGPDAVIEVRSEDDETYEKLPFYATIGVKEVVVVDAKTSAPEVFRLRGGRYYAVAADADGWVVSEEIDLRLKRTERGGKPSVAAAPAQDPGRATLI